MRRVGVIGPNTWKIFLKYQNKYYVIRKNIMKKKVFLYLKNVSVAYEVFPKMIFVLKRYSRDAQMKYKYKEKKM